MLLIAPAAVLRLKNISIRRNIDGSPKLTTDDILTRYSTVRCNFLCDMIVTFKDRPITLKQILELSNTVLDDNDLKYLSFFVCNSPISEKNIAPAVVLRLKNIDNLMESEWYNKKFLAKSLGKDQDCFELISNSFYEKPVYLQYKELHETLNGIMYITKAMHDIKQYYKIVVSRFPYCKAWINRAKRFIDVYDTIIDMDVNHIVSLYVDSLITSQYIITKDMLDNYFVKLAGGTMALQEKYPTLVEMFNTNELKGKLYFDFTIEEV